MRRPALVTALLVALASVAAPVGGPLAAQPSGPPVRALRGRVVDAATGAPVDAAEVAADGAPSAARTGANGEWRLAGLADGTRVLRVRRVGYATAVVRVVLAPGVDERVVVTLTPAAGRLDAVVVTAARRAQLARDAVVSTEVVGRREIEETAAADVASVLRERTGVQFSGGHPAGSGVALQGLDDQRVLVLVDGLPLYGRISGGLDLTRIPTSAVERIEVVKGPQSTLYGSEAMGGVVNVVTRTAGASGADAELRALVGSDRRSDTDLYASARRGKLALTTVLGRRTVERTPGIAAAAGAHTDRLDALGSARWQAAPSLVVDASALALDERQRWPSGALFDFADNTQLNARVGAAWTAAARRVASTVHLSRFGHLSRTSASATPVRGTGDRQTQRLVQADALYTQRLGGATLDAGAVVRQEYLASSDGRVGAASRTLASAEPYAQAEWSGARWSVVPGARLSWHARWGTAASPRLAARWRPVDALTVRASAGRGFRAPDFKELYLDFTNDGAGYAVRGNAALRPERSNNLSLGVEWDGRRAHARGQLFRNVLRDFIETRPLPDAGGIVQYTYGNVGRGATRGAELDAGVTAGPVRLEGGYAYLHARDLGTGAALLGQAAHSGRLRAAGALLGTRVAATAVYTGRTPMERDAAGAITGARAPFGRVDLRAARRVAERAELSFGIDNALDARPARWADATARQVYAGVSLRARRAAGAPDAP